MTNRHFRVLCLVVGIGLCACLTRHTLGADPKRGGTLTVVQGVDIPHLDVQSAPGYESVWINMNIHNSLLNLNKDLNVVPDLAQKWEASPDGLTCTFVLHEGVKFHDGTEMDAEVVKWQCGGISRRAHPLFPAQTSPMWMARGRSWNQSKGWCLT